jgi:hypothetical protein
MGPELATRFTEYLELAITNNDNAISNLQTL